MVVNTKILGEVEIDESKIISFANGIVGFPELTDFALVHDAERGNTVGIRWLQSVQEPAFAMPVMDPLIVVDNYNPEVEDELLKSIGDLHSEDMLVLVTVSVPKDLAQMCVNLKAPIVINGQERKACQIITDGDKYPIKFPIYDILQNAKKAGDSPC